MLDFLSQHLDLPKEKILRRACIDPAEVDDLQAFEILGIPVPVEHGDEDDPEVEEEKEEGKVLKEICQEENDDL